jgi:tetratricopeptide (TPR) repeat protein
MNTFKPSPKQIEFFKQARQHQLNGQLVEAANKYKTLLNSFPNDLQIMAELGLIAMQQKNYEQAIKIFSKSLKILPDQPGILSNYGMALASLGRNEEAIQEYDKALKLQQDSVVLYNNRGSAYQALGKLEQALQDFDTAISLDANYDQGHFNRGMVLKMLKRPEEAIVEFDHAIEINPDFAQAHNNRGICLAELKHFNEALLSCHQAVVLKPDYVLAYYNRGLALEELKEFQAAIDSYNQLLAIDPKFTEAYIHRGISLLMLHRLDEALNNCQQAVASDPKNPFSHELSGNILQRQGKFREAVASYQQAIDINPDFINFYNNMATAYQHMHEFDQALRVWDQALSLQPNSVDVNWNKAFLKLLIGEFEEGWQLYENRWQTTLKSNNRQFSQPRWLGETALTGKTILIQYEQGFGDFIQFCRYVTVLEKMAAHVILEVFPPVLPLIKTMPGNFTIAEYGQPLPEFDLYCPLMSLPLACKTSLDTIPAEIPYLFADEEKTRLWQQRLGAKNRSRIGLVWAGSKEHINNWQRSIPLQQLESILKQPLEFHCLQKEIAEEDVELLKAFPQVTRHDDELMDFSDTAALINEMDIVITVDTSIAHLAGALGRPVWILISSTPDFRWMLDRSDSPWYPTATLFRQKQHYRWMEVIDEVQQALENFLNQQAVPS